MDGQQSLFEAPVAEALGVVATGLVWVAIPEDDRLIAFRDPSGCLAPGAAVWVPVGRREVAGIVVDDPAGHPTHTPVRPKEVLRAITGAGVSIAVLRLVIWSAAYYRCPLGTFLGSIVPASVRDDRHQAMHQMVRMSVDSASQAPPPARLRGAWDRLRAQFSSATAGITLTDLGKLARTTSGTIQRLAESGHLLVTSEPRRSVARLAVRVEDHVLTPAQTAVMEAITSEAEPAVHLLHGVTGSGKTLVYIELALLAIATGRQVLLLLPEIALTPQVAARITTRIARTVVLHSGLPAGERADVYRRIAAGEVDVVVGPRSALFAPLPSPGLIIVDEEHDSSYKQAERSPRYHARDLAVMYGKQLGVPVILGSATPSLESWHHAQTGRYRLHRLVDRPGGARLPTVHLVDMRTVRAALAGSGAPDLAPALVQALRAIRGKGEQAILLLNRRGWSPTVLCEACGERQQCTRCDIGLTVTLKLLKSRKNSVLGGTPHD